jgi:hypothetical protein
MFLKNPPKRLVNNKLHHGDEAKKTNWAWLPNGGLEQAII